MFDSLDPPGPMLFATLLLVAIAIDAPSDRRRPLWLRLAIRAGAFAALTWLVQMALGSPVSPQFPVTDAGHRVWAQLLEVGWWIVGARLAVGVLRLLVV